ncbi:Acyl-ACP thioesterase [Ruminococcaceae bacterium FB2012]|nr:Acyl-ACP thioesterase [Ruminococcaceae bacterium FB2012]
MTEIKRETFYSHFDVDSRMRRSAIIDFMQDCCTVSRSADPVIGELMRSGKALLYVAYRQIDIVSQPRYREELTVRTGLFESRRIYGRRTTVILGGDGEVRAKSYLVSALVDAVNRKPLNLPKEQNDRLELCPPAEMELTPRKITVPEEGGRVCPAFTALRCQADTNGHINNARYADLGDELIPAGAEVTRMRFEYKSSFMPGDRMIPTVYDTETGCIITLANDAGNVCAVIEYVFGK